MSEQVPVHTLPLFASDRTELAKGHAVLDDLAELRAEYLEQVRAEMRRLWHSRLMSLPEERCTVSADDARAAFERLGPPPPEELSRSFLGGVFRTPEWEAVGMTNSTTPGSHGNLIRVYRWRGE